MQMRDLTGKLALAVLAIAAVTGAVAAYAYLSASLQATGSQGEADARVYYIVPTAWTLAIYDENFNRVDKIVVEKGDIVTLIVLPEPFVPEELHEEVEHEFMESLPSLGVELSQEELNRLHEEAEESLGRELYGVKYLPHGLAIEGYEDKVNLDLSSGYPAAVTFKADRAGSFTIYCSVFCGWGHQFMSLEGAFVVQG